MINYELYITLGEKVRSFRSEWQFKEGEQVFVHASVGKRNFVIVHITHDVNAQDEHVVRLYCQEKKVY